MEHIEWARSGVAVDPVRLHPPASPNVNWRSLTRSKFSGVGHATRRADIDESPSRTPSATAQRAKRGRSVRSVQSDLMRRLQVFAFNALRHAQADTVMTSDDMRRTLPILAGPFRSAPDALAPPKRRSCVQRGE